jgi:Fe-S-cluster containining protein
MPVVRIRPRDACGACGSCCYYFKVVEVEALDLQVHGTPVVLTEVVNGERRMRRRPATKPGRIDSDTVCVGYDEEARRCKIYDQRPGTCREFKINEEPCVRAALRYGDPWLLEVRA